MTETGIPLLIASLPARSLEEAKGELLIAQRAGADLAEIRFDRWPGAECLRMAELFPSPLPLLATLRSTAEGGEGPSDPESRRAWQETVLKYPFEWLDIEIARDPLPPRVRAVLSAHLPGSAPARQVRELLRHPPPEKGVVKVVVPGSMHRAIREVLPLLPPTGEGRLIVHTTGPSGPLFRAWARRLGLAGVYGSLPHDAAGSPPAVEPTQIPVDRLRRFLDAEPSGPLFAVVGRPIAHSRSPDLHHFWMRREGRSGLYIALEIADDAEFVEAIEPLADGGFLGLNVTHPFKVEALRLATRAEPGAIACGCANTLTLAEGEVVAENTDLLAVIRRLSDLEHDHRWDGSSMLVVGAGGAARAALAAAQSLGVRPELLARDPRKVEALGAEFHAEPAIGNPGRPASLVVHATTVGRAGVESLAVPLEAHLGPSTYVLDFVYRPDHPSVAGLARRAGAAYEDGTLLLGYAAAASYERWWDTVLEPATVADAVRSVMA